MSQRSLYLVAYDISNPRRLHQTAKVVKAFLTNGQKSVAECLMTPLERDNLLKKLSTVIDEQEDRIHCFRLDPRQKKICLGTATHTDYEPFIIS